MPAPINPRKRALMPSTPLRRTLRAAGHHLSPVVQVGKEGITEAVLRQLDEALRVHELVKVKVGTESPEDRFEAAERIAAGPDVQVAQVLGRTMLVYRRHPERPRFEPAPRGEAEALEAPVARRAGARKPAPGRPGRRPGSARGAARGAERGPERRPEARDSRRRPASGRPQRPGAERERRSEDRGWQRRPASGRPPGRRSSAEAGAGPDRGPRRRPASGRAPARGSGARGRPTSGRPAGRRPATRRPKK